jgi:hypothetical protein
VYARLKHGKWAWRDDQQFACALNNPDSKAGLEAIAPNNYGLIAGTKVDRRNLDLDKTHIMGVWGEAPRNAADDRTAPGDERAG